MWHGRRADFAFPGLLSEIFHGNIGPYIPAKVNQDGIDPFDAIKMSSQVVIMLNLCGVLLALKPQFALTKCIGKPYPVGFGIGHHMGIEIARCATKFTRVRNLVQQGELVFNPLDKYHNFFAKIGWRSRLAVGSGQHGNVLPAAGQFPERKTEVADGR